jgi:hypothetical protein
MIDISNYFGSLATLASLTVIITGYINTHLFETGGVWKQLVSWIVAISLAFIGQSKGIGIVADTDFWWTLINGLSIGLVANGLFDVTLIQNILQFLKAKK